jgi:hypothetical protein
MSTTTLTAPIPVDIAGVHARPGVGRLVAVELRKILDTRAGFWMQLATVAITALVVIVRLVAGDATDHTFASVLDVGLKPAAVLLPIAGILLVTSEWSQRTGMITFALVPMRSRVLGAKLVASLVLAVAMLAISVAIVAAGVLVASPGVDGAWSDAGTLIAQSAVYLTGGMITARHRRALRTPDRVDGGGLAVLLRRRRPVAGHPPRPRPDAPGGLEHHAVGARRQRARALDAAAAVDRHLADHAARGGRVTRAPCREASLGRHVDAGRRSGVEMGALTVVIEDAQDLGGSAVTSHAVRGHRVEAGRPSGGDEDLAARESQPDDAVKHVEPVAAGVDARLV